MSDGNKIIPNLDQFLANCHRRKYPAKSTIIYAGDESDALYYILKGSVTVMIEDDDGREMIMAYLNEGDFFGEMGLFQQGTRTAWCKAKTDCEVAELSYAKFNELSEKNSAMLFALTSQVVERLSKTTKKVGDLTLLDVTGRVARTLLDLSQEPDAMTHIPTGCRSRLRVRRSAGSGAVPGKWPAGSSRRSKIRAWFP